jgi:hypothetical protein
MSASPHSDPDSGHSASGQDPPGRKLADLTLADVNRFMRDTTGGGTALVRQMDRLRSKAIVEGGKETGTRTVGLLKCIRASNRRAKAAHRFAGMTISG